MLLYSFSMAIHTLSQSIYPPVPDHTRSLAETVYLTFFLTVTVTVGGLAEISTDRHYAEVSRRRRVRRHFVEKVSSRINCRVNRFT